MLSSFTLASADVVKASAQPDYRPAGIGVDEADPLVAISAPRAEASRPVRRILRLEGSVDGYPGGAIRRDSSAEVKSPRRSSCNRFQSTYD
jgi:hypothetical protein